MTNTARVDRPSTSRAMQAIDPVRLSGFHVWKDFVHDNFPWLEHRDQTGDQFEAEISAFRFGKSALTTISAGASEVIRTDHLAATAEAGHIKLLWQLSGELRILQDDRECVLGAGQATVCDTSRPYRVRLSEHSRFAVFMLPHEGCPGWEHISPKICAARLPEGPSITAALGALMALTSLPTTIDPTGMETVVKAVQSMLSVSLHQSASALGVAAYRNPRLSRAQQHIIDHIGDPRLDANDLASALCMSRRSLYMLFKEYRITPGKMIHDVRLEQSLHVLSDLAQQHRKISDIALDHGFNDYATFSRLFKAQYGLTPSEARLRARSPKM